MLLNIILTVFGFALLVKSADFFVEGAASLAKNFKISTLVVGLTIVSFGTSAPEIAISFNAHLSGNADLMFGNVIGSSITNILVILGAAIIINPVSIKNDVIYKQIPILLLVTLGFFVLLADPWTVGAAASTLNRADAIILLLFFSIFIYYLITLLTAQKNQSIDDPKYSLIKSIVITILALGGVILGSNLAVNHLEIIAKAIGISDKIISVTIVAVGTSLPELLTTIIAARKGDTTMAVGNIIGTNIFNIAIVLGVPILMLGEVSTTAFGLIDFLFMLGSVLLLWRFCVTEKEMKRYEGGVLLASYGLYVTYILMT